MTSVGDIKTKQNWTKFYHSVSAAWHPARKLKQNIKAL